jgi:hypothetical protein
LPSSEVAAAVPAADVLRKWRGQLVARVAQRTGGTPETSPLAAAFFIRFASFPGMLAFGMDIHVGAKIENIAERDKGAIRTMRSGFMGVR